MWQIKTVTGDYIWVEIFSPYLKLEELNMDYKDFSRCVICRSKYNLEKYEGEFEVTMLLNSLYLTVMYSLENRKKVHLKSRKLEPELRPNTKTFGNDFEADEIAKCLRNALAHFNIALEKDGDEIAKVILWAENSDLVCKNCGQRYSKLYNTKEKFEAENGQSSDRERTETKKAICMFEFSLEQLRSITNKIIDSVLKNVPEKNCENCELRDEKIGG